MLKQVFLAHFERWWRVLAHGKSQNALPRGYLGGQKWFKNGSKTRFSKSDLGPFGMLQQVFLTDFEPVVLPVGPWKLPRSLGKARF